MDKIILDLLKENGRVIIPDFGALIVKQKSPFTVIFNEFLQYNDGALIGAIATKNAIERDDAAAKTKEFTKEIQGKLDKGEEISLEGIGVLTKSATGKISIKEAGETTETPKKQEKPVEKKTEEVKTVEFDLEETKKPEEKPPLKKEPPKSTTKKTLPGGTPSGRVKKELPKSSPKKEIPGSTQKKPLPKAAPKTEVPKKEMPKAAPVAKAAPAKTASTQTASGTETPPITEYYSEGNGRNKWSIILWIVVIVVVNGAIIGFVLFRDELKSFFAKKDNIETSIPETSPIVEETPPAVTETPGEEAVIEPVIDETPEEVEVQEPVQEIFAGTKYYVVAGVFKIESNADKLVIELRKKGYNAEKFGKIGNMHAVSYDVFPTKREADRLMLKIQREVDKGAWIKIVD